MAIIKEKLVGVNISALVWGLAAWFCISVSRVIGVQWGSTLSMALVFGFTVLRSSEFYRLNKLVVQTQGEEVQGEEVLHAEVQIPVILFYGLLCFGGCYSIAAFDPAPLVGLVVGLVAMLFVTQF